MNTQPEKRFLFYVEQNYCFNILRPIQRVLWERGHQVAWLPVGDEFDRKGLGIDERVFDEVGDAIKWKPDAVMVPGNFVPSFIPGIKVMVSHGLISEKRRIKDGVIYSFIERGLFDLYITHGPNTTGKWREMASSAGYFEVAECGWSKLDPLFDGSLTKQASESPVIYFASTFSPRLTAAPRLFKVVKSLLQEKDWNWLIHFHPKMPTEVTDLYRQIESEKLLVIEGHDTLPLLMNADVMLCDTSSIISEFALLQKPIVTFRNLAPKPYMIDVRKPGKVAEAIETALSRPAEILQHIKAHVAETHPWNDGRCSERIVIASEKLIEKGLGHLKGKPKNLLRHWKMRRELNYYRFF